MTYTSVRILQPPTPDMLDDKTSLYRFLVDIYNRTGGFESSSTDLKGLTASVSELNMLEGIRLDEEVQAQLNGKLAIGSTGTMAQQNANNVSIYGGSLTGVGLNVVSITGSQISSCSINSSTVNIPTGSTAVAIPGGVLNVDFGQHFNTGSAETILTSYNLLANTLAGNSYIEIIGAGSFAATATNKRLRLKIGATTIFDSTAVILNTGVWMVNCIVGVVSSAAQKCIIVATSSNPAFLANTYYVATAVNLATDLMIEFTGEATNTGDVQQDGLIIKYYKG